MEGSSQHPRHSSVPYSTHSRMSTSANNGEISRSLLLHGILRAENEATTRQQQGNQTPLPSQSSAVRDRALFTTNTGRRRLSSNPRSPSLNTGDTLQMVSSVIHRHIALCEERRKSNYLQETGDVEGMKRASEKSVMSEALFVKPRWQYHFIRSPHLRLQSRFVVQKLEQSLEQPATTEIFTFLKTLFTKAKLSGECSIVCLIYMERLMDTAQIELLSTNWKPIVLCSLLLASKVWQDHSSWNIEFACIYPHYSLQSINRLEREFIMHLKWDLYISGNLYAKYYFALSNLNQPNRFNFSSMSMKRVADAQMVEVRSASMRNSLHSTSMIEALAMEQDSEEGSSQGGYPKAAWAISTRGEQNEARREIIRDR